MRKARDIFSRAVLPEAEVRDRNATLLVNRALDPLLKCGSTYNGLDIHAVAAAIKADPAGIEDFQAAVAIAYDVLEKVDMITELVTGRRVPLAS
jgi:hypothetical protein